MQGWREGRRPLKCKNMRLGKHQKPAAAPPLPHTPPTTSHGRLIACLHAAEPFVLELQPWS